MQTKMFLKQSTILLFLICITNIYSKPTFSGYKTQIEKHFSFFNKNYQLVATSETYKNNLNELQVNWTTILNTKDMSSQYQYTQSYYKSLVLFTKDIANELKNMTDATIQKFYTKMNESNLTLNDKDIYQNSKQVIEQEIVRADMAYRERKYLYAAQLYYRGLFLISKTYSKLSWEQIPELSKLETQKKEINTKTVTSNNNSTNTK